VPTPTPDHFYFLLALQALGLILGWVIVHKLAVERDLNKERRSLVSEGASAQIEKVNSLLIDARKYHTSERSEEAEQAIKMALQDMSESVSALRELVKEASVVKRAQGAVKSLRIAVTGQHFEDEHDGPLLDPHVILETIAFESLRTKRALLALQHVQYRQTH
jgi:hypothetical protein